MFALSLNELNMLDIAGVRAGPATNNAVVTADVAADLVALARSDDPSCARSAVGAIATLSENVAAHDFLLNWGADFLSNLVTQLMYEDVAECEAGNLGLVRDAARCIANLSGNYAMHPKLLKGGAAEALVRSLKKDDAITTRFAVLGVANLSGQVCVCVCVSI